MANIGYDADMAFHNFVGRGNYGRTLISSMSLFYEDNDYFLYTPEFKESSQFSYTHRKNIFVKERRECCSEKSIWCAGLGKEDLKRDGIELFHGLSGELPELPEGVKSVVTIHDLIFMRYPEHYSESDRRKYESVLRSSCERADAIIAISRQTADDIVKYLGADPGKIEVVYQGCDKEFYIKPSEKEKADIREKYGLPERFVLNVGTIEERKNLANVIRAMKSIHKDFKLVAVGKETGYTGKIMDVIEQAGLKDRVVLLHNVEFADMPAIYGLADAVTYLSKFEGFGIPVLEAFNCGTPVIASNTSSMPEAGGDAAVYADPLDPASIGSALGMVLNSPTVRESMIRRGYIQAEKFKEERVAKNIYDIYNRLLKNNSTNRK